MIEQEGAFTDEPVDMDEWKRRARSVNAAIRVLQIDAKTPKASRFSNLTGRLAPKKSRDGLVSIRVLSDIVPKSPVSLI